jgi:hypothetical protein
LAGGKLDDITVIVGQVVSSQHIFFPWLRIKLVKLVENRKKHSNHSHEVLIYSWLLGCLVKFEDLVMTPRKLKVSTFEYKLTLPWKRNYIKDHLLLLRLPKPLFSFSPIK